MKIKNTLTILKDFCTFDFVERNCERAISLLTEDICWFGTAEGEEVSSIVEARAYLEDEIKAMQSPYRIEIIDERYIPVGECAGVAFVRAKMENKGIALTMRMTASSRFENGEEKLCSMHFSVPDTNQQPGEYFPVATHQEMEDRAKAELVQSTMSGGLVGAYVDDGFPVYFINQRMLTFLDYTNEDDFIDDVNGLLVNSIHPEDVVTTMMEIDRQINAEEHYVVEYRMKKKDGSYIWVHDIGKKSTDKDGKVVVLSVCYDIIESKNKQAQLDNLIQNISCGIVVGTISLLDHSYEIQYINTGFCKLFESTEEELRKHLDVDPYTWIHWKDLNKAKQLLAKLMESKAHVEGTFRYVLPTGNIKWIRIDINVVMLSEYTGTTYATYYDVTTQVQQEQQLKDIIHNVPGGVCLYRWNDEKLHPIILSEQFSKILGEDATQRMKKVDGLGYGKVHPDDLQSLQQAIRDAAENTGKIDYVYRVLNAKTHEYCWVYLQGIVVPQTDGTKLAYVSYTDITKERLTAQQLRASERALDAATEQAGLWYWNYDPSNNRAYFNPRCTRDFDLPTILENYPQAWLDKGFILPEYCDLYFDAAERTKAGEPQVIFEAQVEFKDGVIHWAEFRFTNLFEEDGTQGIIICTGRLIDYEKLLIAKYELERQKPSLGDKNLLVHAVFNLDTMETVEYDYEDERQYLERQYKTLEKAIQYAAESIIGEESKKKFLELNDPVFLKSLDLCQ